MKNKHQVKFRDGAYYYEGDMHPEDSRDVWFSHLYRATEPLTPYYYLPQWAMPESDTTALSHVLWRDLGNPFRTSLGKLVFRRELEGCEESG